MEQGLQGGGRETQGGLQRRGCWGRPFGPPTRVYVARTDEGEAQSHRQGVPSKVSGARGSGLVLFRNIRGYPNEVSRSISPCIVRRLRKVKPQFGDR